MKYSLYILTILLVLMSCKNEVKDEENILVAEGTMPNAITDTNGNLHLVYGKGDSIMYASLSKGQSTFSSPTLVTTIPKLAASHMRGPQIAAGSGGLTVIACDNMGDIFSVHRDTEGSWSQNKKINDADTVAKEGLMAIAGEGNNVMAIWLDLREGHNKIYGASSADGGVSWSANKRIYSSPDSSVCECCKPSVLIKDSKVYVMFRNWLNGNRDMYLTTSADNGNNWDEPTKLGNGHWELNGCPMDGGGLTVNAANNIETVWRREKSIFTCEPGKPEKEIGEGRSCTITNVNGKNVYAWNEKKNIVVLLPDGKKVIAGNGQLPLLKEVNSNQVLCLWEKEKKIYAKFISM